MSLILDPRRGDAEDDAASPKSRSLFAIAGKLVTEVSLAKLVLAWTLLMVLPALLVGLAPLVATGWLTTVSAKVLALAGFGSFVLLVLLVAVAWFGARPLFHAVESSFWSLNGLAVQPTYALCREGLRHLLEKPFGTMGPDRRMRLRAAAAFGAGLIVAAAGLAIAAMAWPASRWVAEVSDLIRPLRLVGPALANALVVTGFYLAAASLAWGVSDATMAQAEDLPQPAAPAGAARTWRVAHLSDLHVVGERYGFRLESGRRGPRGNGRPGEAMARLAAVHAERPVDIVLFSGDMTDAGRSTEWAEFLDLLDRHPDLAARSLLLPGNHDLNIVDRANPARMELPASPGIHWRRMRALSAMEAVQGDRVRVLDADGRPGMTLAERVAPHRAAMAAFAESGGLRRLPELARLWEDVFPMVLPPRDPEGLGVVLLNSNADTHFSFTNALGMVPLGQAKRLAVIDRYPQARWIVALHHHLVEYPGPARALSERIGTALINGSWFVRQLQPYGRRCLVMHGHRHVDWIGRCGAVTIVSAPSPVMAPETAGTWFHVQTLAAAPGGGLALAAPERIDIPAPRAAG